MLGRLGILVLIPPKSLVIQHLLHVPASLFPDRLVATAVNRRFKPSAITPASVGSTMHTPLRMVFHDYSTTTIQSRSWLLALESA